MPPDSADAWATRLLDPRRTLGVILFGHVRTPGDWRIGRRCIPEHLLYLLLENTLVGRCGDQQVRVQAPALLWLDPGVEHEFANAVVQRPIRLYHLRFRLEDDRGLGDGVRIFENAGGAQLPMAELFEEHQRRDRSPLRFRSLLAAMLLDALRRPENTAGTSGFTPPQQRKLRQALVDQGYWLRPGDLADELRLSLDHFRRLFRVTYRTTPQAWILSQRVSAAASLLLESDETVSEVAERLGYQDVFLFSRQFKKITGASPTAYRRHRSGWPAASQK